MAWNYNPKEFIKVYRKFMQWEWYEDANTTKIFLHCLLKANWKATNWHGIHLEPGQFITSLPSLAADNGLSIRQARTALEHLKSTGEVTDTTTDTATGKQLPKCRIITVNNWDNYQSTDRENDRESDSISDRQSTGNRQGERQAIDRQPTADIRTKEYKNNKEHKNKNHTASPPPHFEVKKFELPDEIANLYGGSANVNGDEDE